MSLLYNFFVILYYKNPLFNLVGEKKGKLSGKFSQFYGGGCKFIPFFVEIQDCHFMYYRQDRNEHFSKCDGEKNKCSNETIFLYYK